MYLGNIKFYFANIDITYQDYPDNEEDPAVIVYFEGCSHNCPDCQNLVNQIRKDSDQVSFVDLLTQIKAKAESWRTKKIVFSGGDPFYHTSSIELRNIIMLISTLEYLGYSLCVYTGFSIDQISLFYKEIETSPEFQDQFIDFSTETPTLNTCQDLYQRPHYLKCGVYNELEKNSLVGKTDEMFILASKNQNFYKWDGSNFIKKSFQGTLKFK